MVCLTTNISLIHSIITMPALIRPNLYDYLKVFAICLMIVDHIGFFLYPDIIELRAIWRLSFPLFFLLIGRNGSSRIHRSLIVCACIIQWSLRGLSIRKWYDLRQFNILPVAIAVKLILWWIRNNLKKLSHNPKEDIKNQLALLSILILCVALAPLSQWMFEYWSMWLAMAIVWYMSKQYNKDKTIFFIATLVLSIFWLTLVNKHFPFSAIQWAGIMLFWSFYIYWFFYTDIKKVLKIGAMSDNLILWVSNNAVWIYLLHFLFLLSLVVFKRK